jgi:NAD(P)-dependent dehydrogenase (short-subunit alcohol dehydrogenase family)
MKGAGLDLSGKVALVTGAASGLGKGAALAMARYGANICVLDIDEDNGERVAREVRDQGREALFIRADMLDETQIDEAIGAVKQHFGRLDILVNNVGGSRNKSFLEQSRRSIRRHIFLNLESAMYLTQGVVPMMIEGGRGGVIINVASTEALRAAPGFAVYAACKAGMVSFTKTLALELAGHNIRSHALAPDLIETEGLKALDTAVSDAQKEARSRYVPLGRMGSPAEFGNVVAFLASDMASYLNGTTLPVDAGATAASGWYRDPDNNWCLYHA